MKQKALSAAIAASLFTFSQVHAGDADIFVFVDQNPLQGIDVEINGQTIGKTNNEGEASTYIGESGQQKVAIVREGETIATSEFQLSAEQDVEVSVVLSKTNEPQIHIYKTGDNALKAIGFLNGQIQDPNGNPLSGAQIQLSNTNQSTTTDSNGNYAFKLPRGIYDLTVSHPDFAEKTFHDIRIVANIGTAAVVKMREKGSTPISSQMNIAAPIEEVLILGKYTPTNESSFTVENMATSVVDAIDMEQIIRFGDSSVASALKRVVGVSIVDGKYAVVRGLQGRYVAPTLNGNLMPTTNPFKRDAELDLFPADVLSGIEIQKSFTANLPASSTAGSLLIKTQGMPDQFKHKIGASFGYNFETTGKDTYTYQGGDSDYFGIDDGYRELTPALYQQSNGGLDFSICQIEGQANCISREDASNLANTLENEWIPAEIEASPNHGLSYSLGGLLDTSIGSLGNFLSLSFDKEYQSKADYLLDDIDVSADKTTDTINTAFNGYFTTGFELSNGNKLESKTLFIRDTDKRTSITDGFNKKEENDYTKTVLEWKEREVFAEQLSGLVYLTETQELNIRLAYSKTTNDIPDRRTYTYFGDFLSFSTVERMWSELDETAYDAGFDYLLPIDFDDSWRSDFKLGALYNKKERENEIVRFGIRQGSNRISLNEDLETLLQPENFDNDAFRLNATTTNSDMTKGDAETTAYYLNSDIHYQETLTLSLGARQEEYEHIISLPNAPRPDIDLSTDDLYPSLNITYRPSDSWQIKAGASNTLSRPSVTEMTPSKFYDDEGDAWIGNPDLVESEISNADLRIDYYFGEQNSISLAYFEKQIDNPVEVSVADGSGSASSARTWRNEEEASISGIELDVNYEFLSTDNFSGFVSGNLAFIDSEVILSEDSARLQLDDKRELQGQSPMLGNIQLGFDHFPTEQKVTLLLNYFDDRIDVATRAPEEVIYEAAQLTVDFNYEILLGERTKIKTKIKNLTNEKVKYTQSDRVIESWKNGTSLSVSLSYNFE